MQSLQPLNVSSVLVNGGWGSWSSWSSCSVTCGGGQRTRQRLCNNPAPSGGGSDCVGSSNDQQTCNTANCPGKISEAFYKAYDLDILIFASFKCWSIAVNGGWGSWSSWSSCSVTCGGGQRTRQRSCNNPAPSGGGSECSGRNSRQQTCNTADCPGEISQGFDKACVLIFLQALHPLNTVLLQWMVGGAHGQVGRHAQQRAAVGKEQDNVYVTILPPWGVEVIVSVATASKEVVPLQVAQVRPLKGLTKHLIKMFEVYLCDVQYLVS